MEIIETRYTHPKSGESYRRRFVDTGARNDLDCNLTELRAASDAAFGDPDPDSQTVGFVRHNDFFGHLLRYGYASNQLAKLKPLTILDVGCGDIQWPWYMHKNRYSTEVGAQYYGLELRATRDWLTATAPNGGLKHQFKCSMNLVRCDLVRDDLSAVPEWPGQFDMVVCYETFEHVPREHAPELMRRLFSWTKPGGTCLFSTPNAGVSRSTAENHLGPDGVSREWTYDAKIALAREAGFAVHRTYGTFTGITYLPEEVQERVKTDPILKAMREFLDHSIFTAIIASPFPTHSNNSLFHLERP